MKPCAMICCLLLAGCGGGAVVKTNPAASRPLPVDSMQPCERATPLVRGSVRELAEKIVEGATLLKECSKKQEEQADWIRRSQE